MADDHPALLTAVTDVLAEVGVDVVATARDGREALDKIKAMQPRIALVDVRMPRLSGVEVARELSRVAPDVGVILYTAYGDRALLTEALDAGARGFVL